jgi:SAM-dependent methyltransferase
LTTSLHARGFDITGVDIDPSRFADFIAANGLDVVACDAERESLPFADGSFDCVLFNEIFEHLRVNLIATLHEVRRVLRKEGLLLLSTPNLHSYVGIVNFLFRRQAWAVGASPFEQYAKLESLGHMGHVREYTAREVTEFLGACGFTIRSCIFRGTTRSRLEHLAVWAFPCLRPYVTVVAVR